MKQLLAHGSYYSRFPLVMLATVVFCLKSQAQGCVAVRGGMCGLPGHDTSIESGPWSVGLAYRWLLSDRHFVGSDEQRHRQEQGTEVINRSHFVDLNLSWRATPRVSIAATLPYVTSDRSSFYEHSGGSPATGAQRYFTRASGLGDARLSVQTWLRNPGSEPRFNVQIGLGLKAPTGDYRAKDDYQTVRGPERRFVDQSIQPGDGGWGATLELMAHGRLISRVGWYGQVFYLFNPRDVNGVSTDAANARGRTWLALQRGAAAGNLLAQQRLARAESLGYANNRSLEDVMSVADQYLVRGGLVAALWPSAGLSANLGFRLEGVPAEDLVGSSNGFRRPGYTWSVEPGVAWKQGSWSAAVFVPVAVYRNRTPSVADGRWDEIVGGGTTGGDAAFADYVMNATVNWHF